MSNITKIINELSNIPEPLRDKERKRVIKLIHDSKHIFVSGSGRSGLMVDGFANRLLQLGLSVSVVGEITSPHTHSNDLIIFNSASGQSEKMIAQVKKANSNGVRSLLFTTDRESPLARNCEEVVTIKAQSKYTSTTSIQPMGGLFEQYSLLFFDSLILDYLDEYNVLEETMIDNHADIE
ncbi:6-phospho-3-hexuloisomerase [Companilactobacillus zhachilii]|uniref:6-phospho-3-hexuloisomerase n=1 Tax=Companilactobacillus zhachilii TaxID=2304606 RepID=UPI004033E215